MNRSYSGSFRRMHITRQKKYNKVGRLRIIFIVLLFSIGWDWYDWNSEKFPTPLFEPLRIARLQGYQPFDSNAHGHSNSTLFSICPK